MFRTAVRFSSRSHRCLYMWQEDAQSSWFIIKGVAFALPVTPFEMLLDFILCQKESLK